MKAILTTQPGGPEVLRLGEHPKPTPGPDELLVKVKATALNRADLLQREGKYPPPKGASPILGLEMAGEIMEKGSKVGNGWQLNEPVCALLPGGGYAEYVTIPAKMAMRIPKGWDFVQAAAVPEVFLTAFQALDWIAKLQYGERVLIHAGASGVGTAAIQIAKIKGAEVLVTASSPKHPLCIELGASMSIDYRKDDFGKMVKAYTRGKGVDVILDFIAAPYFQRNLDSLSRDGRLVLLALMGGIKSEEVNLVPILRNRLSIHGSTLRSRSLDYKIRLTKAFEQFAAEHFASASMKPIIDSVYPWTEVQAAHRYMEANRNQGKIVLQIS
jgi:tumor protein p53-inducible protein 3